MFCLSGLFISEVGRHSHLRTCFTAVACYVADEEWVFMLDGHIRSCVRIISSGTFSARVDGTDLEERFRLGLSNEILGVGGRTRR
jgi:hypothetical protein